MKKVCALIGKYFGVLAVIFLALAPSISLCLSWRTSFRLSFISTRR